jgi:integrase
MDEQIMAIFRKNGNWYIDYYCDLQRLREKIGPSRRQAEQMLAIRKTQILQGKFGVKTSRNGIPFKEIADRFLEYSKATKQSYERDLNYRRHFDRIFGRCTADQITSHAVEKYKMQRREEILRIKKYRDMEPRDVPMSTINRELACLKTMFNLAIKWRMTRHNPVKGVKSFRKDNISERILSDAEIDALVAACKNPLQDIVVIALNTGMRQSEILNLKWAQVDLEQGYITVIKTKSGKQRKIPMNESVRNVLKSRHGNGILVFGKSIKPEGAVRSGFAVACRKAGIGHCRFHDLRHTFATRLVLAGVSLPVVKELLGHASIVTTMRYAHLTPESKRSAVELINRAVPDFTGHHAKIE